MHRYLQVCGNFLGTYLAGLGSWVAIQSFHSGKGLRRLMFAGPKDIACCIISFTCDKLAWPLPLAAWLPLHLFGPVQRMHPHPRNGSKLYIPITHTFAAAQQGRGFALGPRATSPPLPPPHSTFSQAKLETDAMYHLIPGDTFGRAQRGDATF